ncbi:MAG: hypothetical protein LUE93_11480 [Bacteroides sp.]|nr:hypothetical protein [Bacteroides sp.]
MALILAISSCTRDNAGLNIEVPSPSGETTLSFLLDTPMSLPTRALVSTTPENTIHTLDILAFSAENATHEFIYKGSNVKIDNTATDNQRRVTVTVQKKDFPQCFVLIANAGTADREPGNSHYGNG